MGGFSAPELKNEDYGHASGWRADNHLRILGDSVGLAEGDGVSTSDDLVGLAEGDGVSSSDSIQGLSSIWVSYSSVNRFFYHCFLSSTANLKK